MKNAVMYCNGPCGHCAFSRSCRRADVAWRPAKFILPLGAGTAPIWVRALLPKSFLSAGVNPLSSKIVPAGMAWSQSLLSSARTTIMCCFLVHRRHSSRIRTCMTSCPMIRAISAPVARVSSTLIAISVPASLKVSSLKELFEIARAQPGKLNRASITGATDLILRSYIKKSGLNLTEGAVP